MPDDRTMEDLGFIEGWGAGGADEPSSRQDGVRRYYGKYRGVVRQNIDPERRCRVWVEVTDVHGPSVSTWAMPCLPYGGPLLGAYVVPPVNAGVWVEFEHGDPDYPVWSGCWFGKVDPPVAGRAAPDGQPVFLVGTPKQAAIAICDTPLPTLNLKSGGVVLSAGPQCYIAIEPSGVTIVTPKFDVNLGALQVI